MVLSGGSTNEQRALDLPRRSGANQTHRCSQCLKGKWESGCCRDSWRGYRQLASWTAGAHWLATQGPHCVNRKAIPGRSTASPLPCRLLREMQKHSTAAYSLHLQHNKPGYHPSCSQWSSDGAGRKPSQVGGFPSLQSVPTATHSTKRSSAPTVTGILTASASAFSLETLPPATTDSKAETQRCLSGKLGASKYRVLPGQQVVCG